MLEFYQAYADFNELMDLTEHMLRELTMAVLGTTQVRYQERDYDFGRPFPRLSVKQAVLDHNPDAAAADLEDAGRARALAAQRGIACEDAWGLGKIVTEIFEKTAEPKLDGPLFVTAYPAEVSPLARRNDRDPFVTDRFEFFVAGREIANGFSELNDPDDQAERFRAQVAAKAGGDAEAMPFDADYIEALEYGLPPTAGEGIGIDRLVMLLTDSPSIRDVLLFPHMRPR
jgi:lysyl-tRNA synthetase class 2